MDKSKSQPNYDAIYACIRERSQYNLNGLTTLKQVKRICNCNTEDIMKSAKLNEVKKIGSCFSHTSIFDFGITSENIAKSAKQDNMDIYIPQEQNLRGITNDPRACDVQRKR